MSLPSRLFDIKSMIYFEGITRAKAGLALVLLLWLGLIFSLKAESYNVSKNDKSFYNFVETFHTLTKDSLSIDSLLNSKSSFTTQEKYSYYRSFSDTTFWIKIPIRNDLSESNEVYFTIENAYLQSADLWVVQNEQIQKKGHHHNYQRINETPKLSNYPTWKFTLGANETATLYVKVIDSERRTSLELQLLDETGFNAYKTLQIVYELVYVVFLLALMILIILFSIGSKEPTSLLYVVYLFFLIIDYTAIKGFGQTYIWNDSLFLINNIRSLSHALMLFFSTLFFANFYKRLHPAKWVIVYFKAIAVCIVPFLLLYVLKLFGDPFPNAYRFLWQFIMFATISLCLVHFYLFVKKKIPGYLSFAFLLPLLGVQFRNYFVPHHLMSDWIVILSNNAYFYSIIIEVLLISYFVMISARNKSVKFNEEYLKNENLVKEIEDLTQKQALEHTKNIILKSKALISLKELMYIKSDGHYLEFYLENKPKPEIDRNTFKETERLLPSEKFIRIHKSFLVNIDYVKSVNSTQLMLKDGTWLNISRTYKSRIKQMFDFGKVA